MFRSTSRIGDGHNSTWRTMGRLLLVGLLLTCITGLAPSDAAMQMKPGWKAVLRYNPTPGYARLPAPRQRASAPLSTILVTYHGFSPQAQTAFQAAVDIWASLVYSPVTIRIDATWTSLGTTSGILGQAGANEVFSNFNGAPMSNTWYPKALANALAGTDLDPSGVDIVAEFNSAFTDWYLGTDGNTPASEIDFETVVLHECCHGLGFIGTTGMSGSAGSWGFQGMPIIYDQFTVNGNNQSLLNTSLFPNPSTALGAQLTGNNLYLNGPKAIAANGGVKPKLYAPSTWAQGSSVSHLDENTYPWGSSANALMTYALPPGVSLHDPGPIVKGLFTDMGWANTGPTVAMPTLAPDGGTYSVPQAVTISCATPTAAIYYTTTGNDPTTSDQLYRTPVSIAATTTLKAKAFATGMIASTVKTALYTIQQAYVVTPSAGANGKITPNTPQTVLGGTNVVFTATANAGYTVDRWSLDSAVAQTGGAQFTLPNVTAKHSVQVTFKLLTFTVTPSAGAHGTLTPAAPQTVNYGGSLTFLATANAGYTVDSWSLDNVKAQTGSASYRLTNITANHTVTVAFKSLPFHPADVNGDWRLTIDELTAYCAAWKKGAVWPNPPTVIPINYITNAGLLWKVGEFYHYDATKTAPDCWVPGKW